MKRHRILKVFPDPPNTVHAVESFTSSSTLCGLPVPAGAVQIYTAKVKRYAMCETCKTHKNF